MYDKNTSQLTQFYHESCFNLAKSFILKSHVTALAMNEVVNQFYHSRFKPSVDELKPETWRYYLQLNGEYHEYDHWYIRQYYENHTEEKRNHPDYPKNGYLRVTSLDTFEKIDFTKENLQQHRATWVHYLNKGEYYQNLIKRFPDLHVLIDGICNPIPFHESYDAPEFTILRYDQNLVEKQEIHLISEIQAQIYAYMGRFHSRGFTNFNPLYRGLRIALLAQQLPGMIISIRESYVNTIHAHSYHIWNYLGGYHELDKYRRFLTFEQAMYFYQNIRYIDIQAGKQETFQDLIQYLLTLRDIPIFKFDISKNTSRLIEEGITEPTISRLQVNLQNRNYKLENQDNTLETLIEKMDDQTQRNQLFREDSNVLSNTAFDKSTNAVVTSKLFETEVLDYSSKEIYPIAGTSLDYWIYMAFTNRYPLMVSISNPKNGEYLSVDAQQGFILYLYCAIKLANLEETGKGRVENIAIPPISIKDIYFEAREIDWDYLANEYTDKYTDITPALNDLRANYPIYSTLYSVERFMDLIDHVQDYKYRNRFWRLAYGDLQYSREVKQVSHRLMFQKKVNLTGNKRITFGKWMRDNNLEIDNLNREQLRSVMGNLLTSFTGGSRKSDITVSDIQKAMVEILKRLSSYTIQFTSKITSEDVRVIDSPFLRFGHIVSIEEGNIKMFSRTFPHWVESRGKEFSKHHLENIFQRDNCFDIVGQELNQETIDIMPNFIAVSQVEAETRAFLNPPRWHRVESTPIRVPPDYYYTHNGTLYYWENESRSLNPGRRGTDPELT